MLWTYKRFSWRVYKFKNTDDHAYLSVVVHAKSISPSPSLPSFDSSGSLLSFFTFLDFGSLSSALLALAAGRFPFPLVPCKIIISWIRM